MNLVRKIGLIVAALMVTFAVAAPALAQDEKKHKQDVEVIEARSHRQAFATPAWGAGLGAGLVILGAGLGFAKIGGSALESMARQPETAGRVQTAMIIIGALLEGVTFFALVICFLLVDKV